MPPSASGEPTSRANGNRSGVGLEGFGSQAGILWRPALHVALTVAVPVGILCFGALPLGLLAIMGGAAWAVGLYAKRTRPTDLPAGAGARIGLVTGLIASWLTVSLAGVGLWVSRFVLHDGGDVDSLWAAQAEKVHQQLLAQPGPPTPEAIQTAQWLQGLMLSADGRAGLSLLMMIFLAATLILLAVAGGALGARLASRPRGPGV